MLALKLISGYPASLQEQVQQMLTARSLGAYLAKKYPERHEVQSDKLLYSYTQDLKKRHLRKTPLIDKVVYDTRLDVVHNALGLHTAVSRNHGGVLKAKKEIRIASLFKEVAPEFLRMIVVHELAHLKEFEHNKAFYQLCEYMQPGYAQLEFDLRLVLIWRHVLSQERA